MFHTNRHLSLVLWGLLFAMATGCTGNGCGGCTTQPLPAGGLPASQTVEGGAQMRITKSGFEAIESLIIALFDDSVGDGFCVDPQYIIEEGNHNLGLDVGACLTGTCTGGAPGCDVDLTMNDFTTQVNGSSLTVAANFSVAVPIDLTARIWLLGSHDDESCTINVSLSGASVSFDIGVGIDNGTGELDIQFQNVNDLDLGTVSAPGCGVIGDLISGGLTLVDSIAELLTDELGIFFGPLLGALVDQLADQFLPDPLGLAGVVDLGSFLADFSPSTEAGLETKLVPGGYAYLEKEGLSLGVITGFNADYDPSTRGADKISEPVLCVPPLTAPDFAAAPHNLNTIARNYGSPFKLLPAGAFRGNPDPAGVDVAMGASETMLDLMGHHVVTSGAMCLSISTEAIEQFNLGTIGLIVPSLAELGSDDGRDPLMLVTRPLEAIDFHVGAGTIEDPALTINLDDFEIDFYAFLFERWVRGFTISLDATIGINLEFTTDGDGNPAVIPVLTGLDTSDLHITVLNSEFLRESKEQLEAVFPSLLDLALPLVTSSIGEIALPSIGGLTMTNLQMSRVTTSEDDFLAIYGGLGTTQALQPMINLLAEQYPKFAAALQAMQVPAPVKVETSAKLASVSVPSPEAIRASLLSRSARLPQVVIDVPATDADGRTLEYTWSLDGGLWRPFAPGGQLVLRDRAFAIQGRYDVLVRARVAGDYTSLDSTPAIVPVVIDSAPPRILGAQMSIHAGVATVPAYDLVSDHVKVAFSPLGAKAPLTRWTDGSIATYELNAVAGDDGGFVVWAEDEQGNRSSTQISYDPVRGDGDGAGCAAGGSAGTLGLALIGGLLGLLGGRRRRRRWILSLARQSRRTIAGAATLTAIALAPGCSCGSDENACTINSDCAAFCEEGTVPLCTETGECLCADDIPFGRVGQYSSMAVASGEVTWVSAYNSTHGDLMVAQWTGSGRVAREAWTFVDGVPDGPVVLEDSDIRGGIFDEGDDVGLYTDIAASGDVAYVSYFDRSNGSLKLAANYDGTWTTHVIDAGSPYNPEGSTFLTVGQYSTITLGPNGVPGIAYFMQTGSGDTVQTELRWAEATSSQPRTAADWSITTVDAAEVTVSDGPGGLRIPEGVGLFANSTRLSDGAPAVVYYDRVNGTLKLATKTDGEFVVETLDGGNGLDVGWYPSVIADGDDVLHISYVDVIESDLLYINTADRTPELVDDGYRLVGTNAEGLPKPEFHFVGDDSAIVMTPAGPIVAYQNATTHELLVAQKDGPYWAYSTVAGNEDPFVGGFGFYAEAESMGEEVVMSSWVVDQPNYDAWVQIFRLSFGIEQ